METITEWAAVAVAVIATVVAGISASAAKKQVSLQNKANVARSQPYIWADVRPRDTDGQTLQLVVGNSGPTVAQNVRVHIDRDVPHADWADEHLNSALERFNSGHASMAPGRVLHWYLGIGHELLKVEDPDLRMNVTINADGPDGPIPELTYAIDMNDWRGISSNAAGSLKQVERAIDGLKKSLEKNVRRSG